MTPRESRPGDYTKAAPVTGLCPAADQVIGDPIGSGRQGGGAATLCVPEITADTDTLTAALAYAKAGWYVLPVRRGSKHPGSVVGDQWPMKSSRDLKMITAWFAGATHGIALHCGRSGAVVFDVDKPNKLPEMLCKHLETAPFQATRPYVPGRGHYIIRQPQGRTIGNSVGRLGGGWGEVRGLNGVIVAAPSTHPDGGLYCWESINRSIPVLPDEIAGLLDDASPAVDAATDAAVTAFITEHQTSTRPNVLQGLVSALGKRFAEGESRHQSTVSALTGAMKEARVGLYAAREAINVIRPMFIDAVAKPPASGRQGPARSKQEAESEFAGILAWAIGQALCADPDEIRARVEEKLPDNLEKVDHIGIATAESGGSFRESKADNGDGDDEAIQTVPWPTLSDAALEGTAAKIVKLVASHTEADPPAMLVQLLAVFGATLGSGPHFVAGNDRHQAIIHPLIVGRTNNGAKGTSLAVVEAVRKRALPVFDACTTSGLSTAEGLIEMVRDPSGDPADKDYDKGVLDKRLLVKESEYKSVLVRQRRDGNTLGQTMRDAWDCKTLRTLTRKHNKLTATEPHIVVIGHVTPREFRATLQDSDLSGGSVNRLLICLSRRSALHPRLGNLPEEVLSKAATLFKTAHATALGIVEVKFTEEFWRLWDVAYHDLNRDRPDCQVTDATARGVTQVLRLALLYALFDGADEIGADHLNAALALWAYAEHGASWLFSNHQLEKRRETAGRLADFVLDGGTGGRTRTAISREYFKGNATAAQINEELALLIHDGVVIEVRDESGARLITRYIHRTLRGNEFTNRAGRDADPVTDTANSVRTQADPETADHEDISYESVQDADETTAELDNSFSSLVRTPDGNTDADSEPPGGVADSAPGYTDRVQRALGIARARSDWRVASRLSELGQAEVQEQRKR